MYTTSRASLSSLPSDAASSVPSSRPAPREAQPRGGREVSASPSAPTSSGPLSITGLSIFGDDVPCDALESVETSLPPTIPEGFLPASVRPSDTADDIRVLHKGLDTVHCSFYVGDDTWQRLCDDCSQLVDVEGSKLGAYDVVVLRLAKQYLYRIVTNFGIAIHIPRDNKYPVMVIAGHDFILKQDTDFIEPFLWGHTSTILSVGDPNISQLRLSRVDVAQDILVTEKFYQGLCKRLATRHKTVISRARKLTPYLDGNRYTGVQVGKSDVVLRFYDKLLEATNKSTIKFWRKVWGEPEIPDGYLVVRIEYQLRSRFLRPFKLDVDPGRSALPDGLPDGIRTLEQFLLVAPLVLLYLTQVWFRLAGKVYGEENYRVTLRSWQAISNGFVMGRWFSQDASDGLWRDTLRFVSKDPDKLLSMALGCLATLAAIRGAESKMGAPADLAEVLEELEKYGQHQLDKWDDATIKRLRCLLHNLPIR